MGLFGDKKKGSESLKTLSEKDIQSRLYGHLRSTDRLVQEDLHTVSKPRHEAQAIHKTVESASTAIKSSIYGNPKASGPDLFQTAEVKNDSVRPAYKDSSHKESRLSSSSSAKDFNVKPANKPASQRTPGPGFFQIFLTGIVSFFKFAAGKAAAFAVWIASASIAAFKSIDFRQPRVRRIMYVLAAVGLLYFIFSGIQHLNQNREKAMKSPHKKTALQKKSKSGAKHPTDSMQSALNAVATEEEQKLVKADKLENDKASEQREGASLKSAAKKNVSANDKKNAKGKPAAVSASAEKTAASGSSSQLSKSEEKGQLAEIPAEKKSGAFVIQVATFATKEDSENLVQKFSSAGFESFFKPVSRSGGRVYYCVFIGRFQTHADADTKLAEFKSKDVSKPFQDAFVRSI